jgi:hypothetical protein
MDRTACTEPQCLYSRAIPLLPLCAVRPVQNLSACTVKLYLYSLYGPYGLHRASVPVQGWPLPFISTFAGFRVSFRSEVQILVRTTTMTINLLSAMQWPVFPARSPIIAYRALSSFSAVCSEVRIASLVSWLIESSTVVLEKLTGPQLVTNMPAFYGTRRFIAVFTRAQHLSLSRVRSVQYVPVHPTTILTNHPSNTVELH